MPFPFNKFTYIFKKLNIQEPQNVANYISYLHSYRFVELCPNDLKKDYVNLDHKKPGIILITIITYANYIK